MQHILDKHTLEHFDFNNQDYWNKEIDMFLPGTTQQQICDYIDESLNWLATNKGPEFPIPGDSETVILPSNSMNVTIGSRIEADQSIIGQFYPNNGSPLSIQLNRNEIAVFRKILE